MDDQGFCRIIDVAFAPFLTNLGFRADTRHISGRLYDATFSAGTHNVSISFEPGDNIFFVMVFTKRNGAFSDIDDRASTPRLSDLNERYMHLVSPAERAENESFFSGLKAQDEYERLLLKYAKELRLVLPRYLNDYSTHH